MFPGLSMDCFPALSISGQAPSFSRQVRGRALIQCQPRSRARFSLPGRSGRPLRATGPFPAASSPGLSARPIQNNLGLVQSKEMGTQGS